MAPSMCPRCGTQSDRVRPTRWYPEAGAVCVECLVHEHNQEQFLGESSLPETWPLRGVKAANDALSAVAFDILDRGGRPEADPESIEEIVAALKSERGL